MSCYTYFVKDVCVLQFHNDSKVESTQKPYLDSSQLSLFEICFIKDTEYSKSVKTEIQFTAVLSMEWLDMIEWCCICKDRCL